MFMAVGAAVVLVTVVGGYLWEGGRLGALYQPAEFVIIGGAAVGSVLISTPSKILALGVQQVRRVFGSDYGKDQYLDLLSMMYQLFKVIQQSGIMSLESHVEEPEKSSIIAKFPKFLSRPAALAFLSDSVKVIMAGGIAPHDLEMLMDEDIQVFHEDALKPSQALAKVADALPGLGIVAAVLGVVITMGYIDGPPAEIGEKVGAALIGTFLGILLSYGFAQPLAHKLEHEVEDETHYLQCIKAGLYSAFRGFPPAVAIEFARRVIPGDLRPTFDETEQACKGITRTESTESIAA
jgi:chemotaxis protein MotA